MSKQQESRINIPGKLVKTGSPDNKGYQVIENMHSHPSWKTEIHFLF